MSLETFRAKLRTAIRAAGYSQKELAQALGLHPSVLSHKLGNTDQFSLNTSDIKRIVTVLAAWQAITTQAEAHDLLAEMGLKATVFTLAEWSAPPLSTLETTPPSAPLARSAVAASGLHFAALPAPVTGFVGREREIADVMALLRASDVRLVTLTGFGGVGKTRLCLRVAAALQPTFSDAVAFVALASVASDVSVASVIAQALGIKEARDRPLLESLKYALRTALLLLVLDNFEHVIAAAPLVGELLAAAPHLKVLVTSRTALRLSGEHEYDLPPLALPDPALLPPIEQIGHYAAVALFVQRAQAVRPAFRLTVENAPAVAEICTRLDGLPLAIELAAARCRVLSPQAILMRLDKRLELLTGGGRDLPVRQQTLRNTIAWSYDLLTPDERRVLRRMAVFREGCTFEAAKDVCIAPDENGDTVLDIVVALNDQSLLDPIEGVAHEPRVRMLEMIREFAQEQLDGAGETDPTRHRHAAHYLALAERADPLLRGPQQAEWLDRLAQDYANILAALVWLLAQPDDDGALRLCIALRWFWLTRGYLSDGRRYLEEALTHTPAAPPARRAVALNSAGVLAVTQGDLTNAARLYEESLALHRGLDDQAGISRVINNLGNIAVTQNDFERATRLYTETLAIKQALGDTAGIALVLRNLGSVARMEQQYDRAADLLYEALGLIRAVGSKSERAEILYSLTWIETLRDNTRLATTYSVDCLALFQEVGDTDGVLNVLSQIAVILVKNSTPLPAIRLFGAVATLRQSLQVAQFDADRKHFDDAIQQARAEVDPDTFAAEWESGGTLAVDAAVAFALDTLAAQR